MSSFAVRAGRPEDNPALQHLFNVPQPSSGLMMTFERAPDYFASAAVMYRQPELMVVTRKQDEAVVAVYNLGRRGVYLNGKVEQLRYGADMRIAPEAQGGRVLLYINRSTKELLGREWYLSVILEDNQRSRSSFEGGRAGLPDYRHVGTIITHTLTGLRSPQSGGLPPVRAATERDIPAMNRLVARMAAHYQFLPDYDFNGLLTGDPFFQGLSIGDFLLVEEGGELRGLIGVWNQKAFKQTRVVRYSLGLALLRPFWNLWSALAGGIYLPAAGQAFDYLALHSPLTRPDDLTAFSALLQAAWELTRRRGSRAMTLTLADNDPRQPAVSRFRSLPMRAHQYTVAFDSAAQPVLDAGLIPFYESGRL
ncbi:hypothetical protein EV700_3352 [Fluviicoccus keumensis]|uniref:N-acetyltransferase domain-containing protein n=1 Tax=Fluviicoccus keumensis TaxID=1435465 RepID=A0A4Q7YGF2_9GAMM|nr:hypothetical protein [Fluviicoccus keumensis]RZU35399.1 hypothetical protein EV700_3352 [Fluviicoccus keumensis]